MLCGDASPGGLLKRLDLRSESAGGGVASLAEMRNDSTIQPSRKLEDGDEWKLQVHEYYKKPTEHRWYDKLHENDDCGDYAYRQLWNLNLDVLKRVHQAEKRGTRDAPPTIPAYSMCQEFCAW